MGSGLILLVIVAAWLAVLVPMAVRSHDSSSSLSSVDRFNDAMRVLSRREQQGRGGARAFVMPARPAESGLPLAVRRRRVLLGLVGAALTSLALGLVGSRLFLAAFPVLLLLATAYVLHLRRQALLRAERHYRQTMQVGIGVPTGPARVTGIPDRMPAPPLPLRAPLPVPAARYEDPAPAGTWEPVAFPVPTYVTAPVAPRRPIRVLDLTRPGLWSASSTTDDAGLSILDEDGELDDILDGRRASGDW